jgi:hypothetical protein
MHQTVPHQPSSYGSLLPNTWHIIIYGISYRRQLADGPELVSCFVPTAMNFNIFEVDDELKYQAEMPVYTGRFIMYSGNTKIYDRKTVGHVCAKPVQIEGTT